MEVELAFCILVLDFRGCFGLIFVDIDGARCLVLVLPRRRRS
jgi:hypothetical protein